MRQLLDACRNNGRRLQNGYFRLAAAAIAGALITIAALRQTPVGQRLACYRVPQTCAGRNPPDLSEARILLSETPAGPDVRHFEYVFPDRNIYVYDLDNGFKLVKHVLLPNVKGVRGSVASAATGILYLSYGSYRFNGCLLAYDLLNDTILWKRHYPFGTDSMSISAAGRTIYMPTGELAPGGIWQVLNARDGSVNGAIDATGTGPHNTILGHDESRVYLGPRFTNYLMVAKTADGSLVRAIGPVGNGVRPFTINADETLAFITTTGLLGFQVGDIDSGKIIHTVTVTGFHVPAKRGSIYSHGISLSPDGRELYVIDSANSYVHVFDVSGLPCAAPRQAASIKLIHPISGQESGCASDCFRDGWIHHSRDGRYVFVGDSGDVIDTARRVIVATLPAMADTRKEIEIDFRGGVPVWAMNNRSSIGLYPRPRFLRSDSPLTASRGPDSTGGHVHRPCFPP
jgi:DNA-binding beta-propeller fold protein YncE